MKNIDQKDMLSEPGTPASNDMIPLCVPEIRGNEWKYIKECLDTNWVSSAGPFVERFERNLADYLGTEHAISTINGTAALHIALLIAGVEPDDEVLVSTLTFISPANAIRYVGAWPVFIDAEPEYWQMDPQKVVDFLEEECRWRNGELHNKTTGRQVKAILPVHILGHPVDMDPILEIANKYDLTVIEDATESLGAKYKGQMIGTLGDIGCFSFNGNKIITTGGGGMIVTDNEKWANKARYLTTQAKDNPLEYIHKEIGFNYRLTNLQAAMGVAQLEQLDAYIEKKRNIAKRYTKNLIKISGISTIQQAKWAECIFWMYTIKIDEEKYGLCSRELLKKFAKEGIQTRPLWQPIHKSPAHKSICDDQCSVSEELNRDALSLPCSVGLKESVQEVVINSIVKKAR